MIICPGCQSPLNDDAKTCQYCGAVLESDIKENNDINNDNIEEIKTEEVKTEKDKNESVLEEENKKEEVKTETEEAKAEEQVQVDPVPMIKCPECSIDLIPTVTYCPNCGHSFVSEEKVEEHGRARYGFMAYFVLALYIISNAVIGFFAFVPLAWTLPLTFIFAYRIFKGEKIGGGTKFWMFMFVNPIVGILSLFMGKPKIRA